MQFSSKTIRMAVACSALFAGLTGPALAHEPLAPYQMVVFKDIAGGFSVLNGENDEAIEKITRMKTWRKSQFEAVNNLCVAYAKSGEIEQARPVCDEAVAKSAQGTTRAKAVALSNRGVLRVIEGDHHAALEDLQQAVELGSGIREAKENLQRLVAANGTLNAANVARPATR